MAAASSYCAASPVAPARSRVPTSPSAPKSNAFLSIGGGSAASAFAKGGALRGCGCLAVFPPKSKKLLPVRAQAAEAEVETGPERFRLNNLSPQPGSRKRNKRKGRGIAAGQGASCGFGMRGQRSRSGAGVRRGFEGGQMPLYRRIPKLKGIAGGMKKGIPKFVTVNLSDIAAANFSDGEEVSLESLKSRRILNPTGKDGKLRLKILGDGELTGKLTVKAGAFSESAKSKLEAAGIVMVDVPGRKKWVKPSVAKHQQRAVDYFAQKRASDSWIEK